MKTRTKSLLTLMTLAALLFGSTHQQEEEAVATQDVTQRVQLMVQQKGDTDIPSPPFIKSKFGDTAEFHQEVLSYKGDTSQYEKQLQQKFGSTSSDQEKRCSPGPPQSHNVIMEHPQRVKLISYPQKFGDAATYQRQITIRFPGRGSRWRKRFRNFGQAPTESIKFQVHHHEATKILKNNISGSNL